MFYKCNNIISFFKENEKNYINKKGTRIDLAPNAIDFIAQS